MKDPISPLIDVAAAFRRLVRVVRAHTAPDHEYGEADVLESTMIDIRRELYDALYGRPTQEALRVAEAICALDRRPVAASAPAQPPDTSPPDREPTQGALAATEALQRLGVKVSEAKVLVRRAVDNGATGEADIVAAALRLRTVKLFTMPTYE